MTYGDFDVIKIKRDDKLSELGDYQLVKSTQKDVDKYRKECYWVCPECGYRIRYEHSLLMMGKYYVHEMRCPEEITRKKSFKECKCKMTLIRDDEKVFDSVYFNELFARYQNRIVWESRKSYAVDSPDEVYSMLVSSFLKISLQFARDRIFTSSSDKWFSSFFWRSVQNKIADLQKTNTYNKRCPTVRCAMCNKDVGQITTRHLSLPGHEGLLEEILVFQGRVVIIDSGEINYYQGDNKEKEIRDRSLFIGKKIFYNKKISDQRRAFESECLTFYSKMFPNALFKNNVASINAAISDEGDAEIEEFSNDSVFKAGSDPIADIEIDSSISRLTEVVMKEIDGELDFYIKKGIKPEELKSIISETLITKGSFEDDLDNIKIDSMIVGVNKGFTEELLYFIRTNDNCRICVGIDVDSGLVPA